MGIESTDQVKNKKQHTTKPIAVGLVFGVGLGLALKSWLLGIMFGIIFCNFQYETPLAQIKE